MKAPSCVLYICFWSTRIQAQTYPMQVGSKVEKLLQSSQPLQELRVEFAPPGGNGVPAQSSPGVNNVPVNMVDMIQVETPSSGGVAGVDTVLQNSLNGGPQTVMINGGPTPSDQWLPVGTQSGGNGNSNGPFIADIWNINEPSGNGIAGEVPVFNAQPGATTVNVGHDHGFNGVSVHPDIPYVPPNGEQNIYPEGTIYDIYSRNIGPVYPYDTLNFGNQNMLDPNSISPVPEHLPIENNPWSNSIGRQSMLGQSWEHTPDAITFDTLNAQNMADPTLSNTGGVDILPGTGWQRNQFGGLHDMAGASISGQEMLQADRGGQGVWNHDWQDVPVFDNRVSLINGGPSGQNAAFQEPRISAGMEQRIRRQMEQGVGITNDLGNWEPTQGNGGNTNGRSTANSRGQNQSGQGRTNGGGIGNGVSIGQGNVAQGNGRSGWSMALNSLLPSNLGDAIIIVVPANNIPGELKSSAVSSLREACQGNACFGGANNGLDQILNQNLNRVSGNTLDPTRSARSGMPNGGRGLKGATYRKRNRKYGSYRKSRTYDGLRFKYGRKVNSYGKPQKTYARKRTYSKKYRKGGY